MKNSIGLYFQLEMKEEGLALSLVRQSLKKIEELEDSGIPVKYLELRARELPGSRDGKEIWLKIDSDQRTYINSDHAFEWEQAYSDTFSSVEKEMLCEEADYTRHAALVELDLPPAKQPALVLAG